jgi:hypothetical protein
MDKKTKDFLNEMNKTYGLEPSMTWTMTRGKKEITIITREGIELIQAKAEVDVTFELADVGVAGVIVKAIGTKGDKTIETFGSASKETSKTKYYAEMAEKRALARVVLKLIDAYRHSVFSEDEADDFKKD